MASKDEARATGNVVFNLNIAAEARDRLREFCHGAKVKQGETLSQIIEWFTAQSIETQNVIVFPSRIRGGVAEAHARALEEEAAKIRAEAKKL